MKTSSNYHVNPENFLNPSTPEMSYLLGLLWADGYLSSNYRIGLECLSSDFKWFLPIFNRFGKWTIYHRHRKNRQPSSSIVTSNKAIHNFLLNNDYHSKHESACKILSVVPKCYHRFWFLGLIDGDGCFYIAPKRSESKFSIFGPFEQNWQYVIDFCNSLNLEIHITRKISPYINSKGSRAIINKYLQIVQLGDYLYQSYLQDSIGLPRKYDKYMLLKRKALEPKRYYNRHTKTIETVV